MQHTTMSSGLGDMRSIPLAGLVSRCSMRTQKGVDCSAVPVVGLSIHQVKRKRCHCCLGQRHSFPRIWARAMWAKVLLSLLKTSEQVCMLSSCSRIQAETKVASWIQCSGFAMPGLLTLLRAVAQAGRSQDLARVCWHRTALLMALCCIAC